MIEKKTKLDVGGPLLVGIIFGLIGILYLFLSLCFLGSPDPETLQSGQIFLPVGGFLLITGAGCLIWSVKKKRTHDRLMENGRYVWGTVAQLRLNPRIRFGIYCPQIAVVHYTDRNGKPHVFLSRNIYRRGISCAVGKQVRVYVENDTYKPYYVDIDPVLTDVTE